MIIDMKKNKDGSYSKGKNIIEDDINTNIPNIPNELKDFIKGIGIPFAVLNNKLRG